MIVIKKQPKNVEIEVKRFYLPKSEIIITCPECNETYKYDEYLSYPKTDQKEEVFCYCNKCEHEWSEWVKLTLKIEVVKE